MYNEQLAISGNITGSSGGIIFRSHYATVSGNISGPISLSSTGARVILSGNNDYSGGTTVSTSGGSVFFMNTAAKPAVGAISITAGNAELGLAVGGAGYFSGSDVVGAFNGTWAGLNGGTMHANAIIGVDTTLGDLTISDNLTSAGRGLHKYGPNTLTLSGNLDLDRNGSPNALHVFRGTLLLTGDNSASAGRVRTESGAVLAVATPNSVPAGTLEWADGSTLRLLNDSSTFFTRPSLLSGNISMTIFVDRAPGGSGVNQTHRLSAVRSGNSKTITVDGANGYGLLIDDYRPWDGNNNCFRAKVNVDITTFNASKMLPLTVDAGATVNIGTVTTTPYAGGGMRMDGGGTVNFNGTATPVANQQWQVNGPQANFNGTMVVNGSANLNVSAGAIGGTGTINVPVTVSGTGGIDLRSGAVNTLALGGNLTISGGVGANNLRFDLGNGAAGTDKITVVGTTVVSTVGAAVISFNQLAGAPIDNGTYTLIQGTGAMDPVTDFALAVADAGGKHFVLQKTGNNLEVVITDTVPGPASPLWDGSASAAWATAANWVGDAIPTWDSNVEFYQTGAGNLSSTLGKVYLINSLNYVASAIAATTIANGGTGNDLLINAGTANGNPAGSAITVATPASGTPVHTISANIPLLVNQTWTVNSGGSLKTTGVISQKDGTFTLTKAGEGKLELSSSGTFVNTYTGGTIVDAGQLDLTGNTENSGRIRGPLTINSGAKVTGYNSNRNSVFGWQGGGVTTVDINGGTLDIAENVIHTVGFSTITMTGGTIASSGGAGAYYRFATQNAGGPSFVTLASANSSVISAMFSDAAGLGTRPASYPFTVADGAAAIDLLFSGVMQFSAPVIKSGPGLMALTAANLYTGATTINGGTLQLGNNTASGSIDSSSGVTLANNATLAFKRTDSVAFSRSVGGTGGLTQRGTGTLTLSGANSYNGPTTVSTGALVISGAGALPSSSAVSVSSVGTLSLADGTARTSTVGGLSLANGANLKFDWNGDTVDTLTTTAAATTAGNIVITIDFSSPLNTGAPYTLIHADGGGLDNATYMLNTSGGYTAPLIVTSTDVKIGACTSLTPLTEAYWIGGKVAGAGNAMALSDGNLSNWSTTQPTYTATSLAPGSGCDVFFSASGATQQGNVVLGGNLSANTITFNDTVPVTMAADGFTLTLNSAGSGASSAISVNESATINAAIGFVGNQTWTVAASKTLSIGSVINGTYPITKDGTGTLVLSGSNGYSSDTTIGTGVVRIQHASSLGTAGGKTIVASGGELQIDGNGLSIAEPLNTLIGTGASGGGALRNLANNNEWTGAITLGTGGARINSDGGTLTLSGGISGTGLPLTIGGAGDVAVPVAISTGSGGTLTKDGAGTVTLTANNTYTGSTTVNGGMLEIAEGGRITSAVASTISFANGGVLKFNTTIAHTWAGTITGAGGIVQNGSGILTINKANNPYSGGTTVSAGTLKTSQVNAIGTGDLTVNTGGTFDFNGNFSQTIGNLTGSGGTIRNNVASTPTLTFGTGNATGGHFHGDIVTGTGNIALTKIGTGTNTLSGANTYTGATIINAGVLALDYASNPTVLAATTLPTLGGGTLKLVGKASGATAQTLGNLTLTAATSSTIMVDPNNGDSTILTLGNTWSRGAAATLLIDYSSANAGTRLVKTTAAIPNIGTYVTVKDSGGTGPATQDGSFNIIRDTSASVLVDNSNNGAVNWSSLDTVYTAGTLAWYNGITTRSVNSLILDTSNNGGIIDMGASGNILTLTIGQIQCQGPNALTLTGGQVGAAASAVTVNQLGPAIFTIGSPISSGAGSLIKGGSGTLVLTAANNAYTGSTTIGGTLEIGGSGRLNNGNYGGAISMSGGATFKYNSSANQTLTGLISGDGALVKTNSASILTLNAGATQHTYSGGTIVDAGQLDLRSGDCGNNGAIRGTLTINSGAIVKGYANSRGIFGSGGNRVTDVTINGGTLDNAANQVQNVNFTTITMTGGTISESGGANATWHFSGSPSFVILPSAVSSVISGRIYETPLSGEDKTDATSYPFTVADGAAAIDLLVSGALSFNEPIIKSGPGLMALTANNPFSGALTINEGTLQLGNNTASGSIDSSSGVSVSAGGTLAFNRSDVAPTFNVVISGSGDVTQLGSGTVTLGSVNNSYSGVTTISGGGILAVNALANAGDNSSIGTGVGGAASLVIDGGTLRYAGAGVQTTDRLLTMGAGGATLDASGGPMTIGNAGGAIAFSTPGSPASLTLKGSGTGILSASLNNPASSTASLTKDGTGTWTLTAANAFSGATTVSGGKLYLNAANSGTTAISVANLATLGGSGSAGAATATVDAGGTVEAGSGGAGSLTLAGLDLAAGAIVKAVDIGNYTGGAAIVVTGNNGLTTAGSVTIKVTGDAPSGSGKAHIIQFAGAIQGAGFPGFNPIVDTSELVGVGVFTVEQNGNYVDLAFTVLQPVWKGAGDGNWISGSSPNNWRKSSDSSPTNFFAGDAPLFDDTATGVTAVDISAADVVPSAVTFDNSTLAYTLTSSSTFGIAGAGPVIKRGANVLMIANNNSFSGQLSVEAGTLAVSAVNNVSADGPLGNSALPVILGKSGSIATLAYTGATAGGSKPFTLAAGGTGAFQVDTADVALTLSGAINGSGDLVKTGPGNLTLSAANDYGKTRVDAGTLRFGTKVALYNGAAGSWIPANITVESGATLALNVTGTGFLAADLDTIRDASHLGGSTLTTGLKSGALLGLDTSNGSLTYSGTFANPNSGSNVLGIRKMGANILALTSATRHSHTGGTIVDGGTLELRGNAGTGGNLTGTLTINSGAMAKAIGNANGFGNTAGCVNAVNINGGTLDNGQNGVQSVGFGTITMTGGTISGLGGASAYFDFYNANGGPDFVTLASATPSVISTKLQRNNAKTPWTFTVADGGAAVDLLVSGVLGSGAFGITKEGAGLMSLTAASTYTLSTTVNAGTLQADLSLNNNVIPAASALVLGGGTLEVKGKSAATASQTVASLTTTVGTSSDIVIVPNGGTLTTLTLTSSTLTLGGSVLIDYTATTTHGDTVGNGYVAITGAANGPLSSKIRVKDSDGEGNAKILSGRVHRADLAGLPDLPQSGAVATETYTVTLDAGDADGSLDMIMNASQSADAVEVDTTAKSGGVLNLDTYVLGLRTLRVDGPNPWSISAGAGGGLRARLAAGVLGVDNDNGGVFTISAPILNNAGSSLSISGTGTLLLSGASTYAGPTTLGAGQTVTLGGAGSGANSPLGTVAAGTTVSSGGALDLSGITLVTAEPLTINGTGIGSGGALLNSSGTLATYSGLITLGSASSIVAGTGDIALSNAGTITGGYGLTLGGTSAASSLASTIGIGANTVTKSGAGTWTLSGNSTYTGATLINGGTLKLGAAGSGANSPLGTVAAGTTVAAGSALDLNGFTLATAEALTLNGTGVSNGGALLNSAASTSVAYSGAIALNTAARINSTVAGRLLTLTGGIAGGGNTLTLGGAGDVTVSVGAISGTGTTVAKDGTGTATLSGINTHTGPTTIGAGTLVGVVGGSCGNSDMTLSAGTLGVLVNSVSQFTGKSLSMANGTVLDFNFTVTPSLVTAPLKSNNSVTFGGTAPTVTITVPGTLAAGDYPLMTWTGSQFGTVPTTATLFGGMTGSGTLSVVGNTLVLRIGSQTVNCGAVFMFR